MILGFTDIVGTTMWSRRCETARQQTWPANNRLCLLDQPGTVASLLSRWPSWLHHALPTPHWSTCLAVSQ